MKSNVDYILKTKMLEAINFKFIILLLILLSTISSEPLSCYQAKCTHCTVEFIAKNCPSVCDLCPYISQTQAIITVS